MENKSPIASRLGRCFLPLQPIFRALAQEKPPEEIVLLIDEAREKMSHMLSEWSRRYQEALEAL